MGYYSRGHGKIRLEPPLEWRLIRGSKFLPDSRADTCLVIETDVEDVDTDQGRLSVVRGVAVAWRYEDEMKAYSVESEMEELVALIESDGTQPSGTLIRVGEEQGDIERYFFDIDVFRGWRSEKAELRWPDGSVCDSYY